MSQSLVKTYVHLVFSTKGRADTLPRGGLADVHAYMAMTLNDYQCPVLTVGGTTNHVHILFAQSKNKSLAEIARVVKSSTSKWINEKRSLADVFSWQDGYGAFSISQNHVEATRAYIASQEEHHKTLSFKDELRRLCQLYGVDLREQYAWD